MVSRQKAKGTSLAKGPVGLIGLALLAYGITAVIFGGHSFAHHIPSGAVHGKNWLGLEVNGWTGLLFIAAGLLLLLAAPLHWSAKGMSLIIGLALAAAALIAFGNGHGALGIFAANHLTELVWGAAAALLVVLSQLPRVGGKTKVPSGKTTVPESDSEWSHAARRAEPAEAPSAEREHTDRERKYTDREVPDKQPSPGP